MTAIHLRGYNAVVEARPLDENERWPHELESFLRATRALPGALPLIALRDGVPAVRFPGHRRVCIEIVLLAGPSVDDQVRALHDALAPMNLGVSSLIPETDEARERRERTLATIRSARGEP